MAVDVPVGWNTCSPKTPGVRCPVEEATWAESTENTVHCACWHESDYGDEPCCWCGQAGRWEGFVARACIDCNNPFVRHQDDSQAMACPFCKDRADEAQRDHQVREAAHDMLAALKRVRNDFSDYPYEWHKIDAAIDKAEGKDSS